MADLGADVIKVEPPPGDPQRGRRNLLNQAEAGPNPFLELPNRGKRSMTVNLTTDGGRDILLRLAESSDGFLTSYLPDLRRRMRIDVEDLRAVNPRLIYVRGSGWGRRGPSNNLGRYASAAAWRSPCTQRSLAPPDA